MINFSKFKEIVSAYFKNKKTVDVVFKQNTSLFEVIKRMTGFFAVYKPNISQDQQLKEMLDFIDNQQVDDVNGKLGYARLESAATGFAAKISGAYGELKIIKATVEQMVSDIDKMVSVDAKQSTILTNYGDAKADTSTFNHIDWTPITILSPQQFLIESIHSKLKINDTDITRLSLGVVSNHTDIKVNNTFKDISLDTETKNKVISYLVEKLNDLQPEDIKKCFNILINRNKAQSILNLVRNTIDMKGLVGDNCVTMLSRLRELPPIMEFVTKDDILLSSVINTQLDINIKTLTSYLESGAYAVIYFRTTYYKDVILLDNRMINSDNYDEFIKNSCNEQDLLNYVSIYYKNRIPVTGVKLSVVVSNKDKLREQVEEVADKNTIKIKLETNKITSKAMRLILGDYCREIDKSTIDKSTNFDRFINRIIDRKIIDDLSIDGALWNFIIELQYRNSFVQVLYKNLGSSYIKQLTVTNELVEADETLIRAGVYAELIVDFIVNNFTNK